MKKAAIALAALLAVSMIAGCSGKSADETTAAATEAETTTEAAEEEDVDYSQYVTLGQYKGVTIENQETGEVTDDDIQQQIETLLSNNTTYEVVDRAAELGDTVNIDYTGYMNDVAFDGGSSTDYDLVLGSNSFIDDFEDQLVGASAGDEVEVNVTFPDPYTNKPEYAGKDAMFKVTVNEVREECVPEYTDEFVAANTDYESIDDYEAYLRTYLQESLDEEEMSNRETAVILAVMENCEFKEVPEDKVEEYADQINSYYESIAENYGTDLDTLLSYMGTDSDTFAEQVNESATNMTKQWVMIMAIAQAENMTVTDDEYTAGLNGYLEDYGVTEQEFMEYYTKSAVENMILTDKVITFLVDNCVEEEE